MINRKILKLVDIDDIFNQKAQKAKIYLFMNKLRDRIKHNKK